MPAARPLRSRRARRAQALPAPSSARVRLVEELAVDLVVRGDVAEVDEERGHLDDVVERTAGSLQTRAQVRQGLPRLLGDPALDQVSVLVVPDLSGRVDRLAGDHHRRVRRLWLRHPLGLDRFSRHLRLLSLVTEHAGSGQRTRLAPARSRTARPAPAPCARPGAGARTGGSAPRRGGAASATCRTVPSARVLVLDDASRAAPAGPRAPPRRRSPARTGTPAAREQRSSQSARRPRANASSSSGQRARRVAGRGRRSRRTARRRELRPADRVAERAARTSPSGTRRRSSRRPSRSSGTGRSTGAPSSRRRGGT